MSDHIKLADMDDALWERILPPHEADLAAANEHDPSSVFYRRPDLVKRHIETAEAVFRDICQRATEQHRRRDAATDTTTKPAAQRSFGVAHR